MGSRPNSAHRTPSLTQSTDPSFMASSASVAFSHAVAANDKIAISAIHTSMDPLDSDEFDPVHYINLIFPTGFF